KAAQPNGAGAPGVRCDHVAASWALPCANECTAAPGGAVRRRPDLLTSSLTAAPACVRPALATGECIKRRRRAISDRALTSPENDRIIVEGRWRAFGTAEAGNHTTDVQTSGLKSEAASALNRRQSP